MELIAVFTTTDSLEEARAIASMLVERRLAACVQISTIESVYTWRGTAQNEREFRLLAKTVSANYAAVDAYEPGSVGKVITIAGALDAGVVEPDTTFLVPWRKQYYDDLLKDAVQHPEELMTVSDILATSSNIGTIMVQEALDRLME